MTTHSVLRYPCSSTEGTDSKGVVIADFTGDGKADIAALYTFNQGFLQVFPGNGDGTFQSASAYQYAVGGTSAFSTADFNGDGRVDIAAIGNPASVTVLEGRPAPLFMSELGKRAP